MVAKIQVPQWVCDVCADHERLTERWIITTPDRGRLTLDLCGEHVQPLEDLLGEVEPRLQKLADEPVVSVDEVKAASKRGLKSKIYDRPAMMRPGHFSVPPPAIAISYVRLAMVATGSTLTSPPSCSSQTAT